MLLRFTKELPAMCTLGKHPKKNMICNVGCTKDSTHAETLDLMSPWMRRVFHMETYEMDFPMKHAKYVIPDVDYEKKRNRLMHYNFRTEKIRRLLYLLFSGKFIRMIQKSGQAIKRKGRRIER